MLKYDMDSIIAEMVAYWKYGKTSMVNQYVSLLYS